MPVALVRGCTAGSIAGSIAPLRVPETPFACVSCLSQVSPRQAKPESTEGRPCIATGSGTQNMLLLQ